MHFSIHRDAVHPWQGHHPQGSEVKQWYETYIFPLTLCNIHILGAHSVVQ